MCSICNNISLAKMIYPDRGHQGGEEKKNSSLTCLSWKIYLPCRDFKPYRGEEKKNIQITKICKKRTEISPFIVIKIFKIISSLCLFLYLNSDTHNNSRRET